MNRFEVIGRIVAQLELRDQASLEALLLSLENNDESERTIITRGTNDTEHLLSSPFNAADLDNAVQELANYDFLMPQHAS